jgi:hypothetical protein
MLCSGLHNTYETTELPVRFTIQKPVKGGILLQRRKLQFDNNDGLNSIHYDTVTDSDTNR